VANIERIQSWSLLSGFLLLVIGIYCQYPNLNSKLAACDQEALLKLTEKIDKLVQEVKNSGKKHEHNLTKRFLQEPDHRPNEYLLQYDNDWKCYEKPKPLFRATERVKLDEDKLNSQTELFMQKINKLQLDMQKSNEVSEQIVNDTQKLAAELTEVSMRIEESLRISVLNPAQSSFVNNPHNNKAFEELTVKNTELAQKVDQLVFEVTELEQKLLTVKEDRDKFESQLITSSKDKKELLKKCTSAMKLVDLRNEELKNRENTIGELQNVASKKVDLEMEIQAQLTQLYSTLSNVTNKFQK